MPSFERRLDERDARENFLREEIAAQISLIEDGELRSAAKLAEEERIKAYRADRELLVQARYRSLLWRESSMLLARGSAMRDLEGNVTNAHAER